MKILKKNLIDPMLVIIAAFKDDDPLYEAEPTLLTKIDPNGSVPWAQFKGQNRKAFWIDKSDLSDLNRLAEENLPRFRIIQANNQHLIHD